MKELEFDRFIELYSVFKQTDDYEERAIQFAVAEVYREIIVETLKNEPLLNVHLTGLIQMFKNGCYQDNFDKYLELNVGDVARREEIAKKELEINQTGYTAAGLQSVKRLTDSQLSIVKNFLSDALSVNTIDEAVDLCVKFDEENIPLVKSGVYSPWLYYINPTIFPIVNNSQADIRKWLDIPADYPSCIRDFNILKEMVGEKELGGIDMFGHRFNKYSELPTDIKVLNLNGKKLFKHSHGIFKKRKYNRDNNLPEIIEQKNWIVIGKNTGANQAINFKDSAQIGDYVYVCYGGDDLYCVAKIISETKLLDKEYVELIDEGFDCYYREIEPLYFPFDAIINLKNERKGYMPSANSTFVEVPKDRLEYINDLLFIPKCKLKIIDRTLKPQNQTSKPMNPTTEIINNAAMNSILYGPPGTGKTFHTVSHSVAIVENKNVETVINENRENVKSRFDEYVEMGQITFCTFHQSLGYEDFIEGIKPIEPSSKEEQLSYAVEDGIFKQICTEAAFSFIPENRLNDDMSANETTKEYTYKEKKTKLETLDDMDFLIENPKRYVLIIDEINRGNVSQVFGELITLIEEDKRLGKDEGLKITLPYSKESFGVPCNLHIIGTMNTADRSVEALDTALRRRFSFINMQPKPNLLKTTDDDIDLPGILSTLNNRLSILKDFDHTIGHAWLWDVRNIDDLKSVFENKIIPLLQEYFYNDYEKLGLVLGDSFFEEHVQVSSSAFADFSGGNGLAGQYDQTYQYRLKPVSELTILDFKSLEPHFNELSLDED